SWSSSRVLAAGALLTGVGFGLTAWAASAPAYLASIAVWTLGEILLTPVASTVVADLSPRALRGTYQGAFHMVWAASGSLGPLGGAWVLGRFGARALWWGCLALGVVSAALHLAVAPARQRRLAALHAAEIRNTP